MFTSELRLPFLVVVLVVLGEVWGGDSDEEDWQKHVGRVERFKCKVPQPRSVSLEEIIPQYVKTGNKIFPEDTVLHRCESAGCCKTDKVCTVQNSEPVVLTFGIIKQLNVIEYVSVQADNHTLCLCQKNGDKPKKK